MKAAEQSLRLPIAINLNFGNGYFKDKVTLAKLRLRRKKHENLQLWKLIKV